MLAGFVYLYLQTGPAAGALAAHSSDIQAFYTAGHQLGAAQQSWLFLAHFRGLRGEDADFSLPHLGEPDTYTESPAPATMLLSGIMLKMGIYGCLRWLLPVVPLGASQWQQAGDQCWPLSALSTGPLSPSGSTT
ncbi:MAG: proton-conducting transporter membrane subunit [Hymenobacter sp.]